ncbi:MAG: fibronectin type III domain-containing protein [archaeon]|nr:fibronectin type III domain-containing protein [archaeon]
MTTSSATITWTTDEPSDSLVKYGTTSGTYTLEESNLTYGTSHSVKLEGLSAGTTYYYVVNSTDQSGNSNESVEHSFPTATAAAPRVGGGRAAPPTVPGETTVSTEPTGEVKSTVTASSADAKASATIPEGTIAKDAAGNPLTKVTVAQPSTLPGVPSGVNYVGYAYNFGPAGVTFSQPVEISITFDLAKREGKTPVIYVYEAGGWKALDTTVDWANNKATARVTHFSTFVLFAAPKVTPTPTSTPTPPPTVTPTLTPTPPVAPTVKLPWPLIIGVIIVVIAIIGAVAYIYTKKKT